MPVRAVFRLLGYQLQPRVPETDMVLVEGSRRAAGGNEAGKTMGANAANKFTSKMKFIPLFICLCAVSLHAQPYSVDNPPLIPDHRLTPGAVATNSATIEQVLAKGYSKTVRDVPESMKRAVFIEYLGYVPTNTGDWEIDHLIPCSQNGDQGIENLWLESYISPIWNAHVKDRLEVWTWVQERLALKLHGPTIAGILMNTYRSEIADNWTNAYIKYLGDPTKATVKRNKAD